MKNNRKIKKGVNVTVISGRDRNKSGIVQYINTEKNSAIVDGVNIVKRHLKPSKSSPGCITQKESWVHLSNLRVADSD